MEGVSWIISESSSTLLSVMIIEQEGLCARTKPSFIWGSGFGDDFQVGSDYIFGDDYRVNRDYRFNRDYYRVNRDCAHKQIQASAGEAVLVTIFQLE
jgi:hypothetical protein